MNTQITQINTADNDAGGDNLETQVDDAVDSFIKSRSDAQDEGKPAPAPEPDEGEAKEVKAKKDEKPEPEPQAEEPKEIDESLLERAVRAGLSMKEARGFGDPEVLLSVLGKLESKAAEDTGKPKGGDKPDGDKPDDGEEEIEIPDLDPNEWDEKLVGAFKALKDLAKRQAREIRELRSAGESARAESWMDGQLQAMGEARRSALGVGAATPTKEQTAAKEKVMSKFKVLEAGYAATGMKMDKAAILEEAVASVIGAEPKRDRKAEVEKRNNLAIARPSHDRVTPKTGGDSIDDIKASVASSISKFYHDD